MKPRTPPAPAILPGRAALLALAVLLPGLALLAGSSPVDATRDASGSDDIFEAAAAVLEARCVRCHNPGKTKGGLLLTTRASIEEGGYSGPAGVPRRAVDSFLLDAVSYEDPTIEMPPTGRIPQAEIDALRRWIEEGMPWPEGRVLEAEEEPGVESIPIDRWCYEPLSRPPLPSVRDARWGSSPIDAFVLARLEEAGLDPAPPASRETLIRRVTYDLTGLPPTPEAVRAFVADTSPDAWTNLVEGLLASPQYGVHWGRHWLDLVRFAETDSYERDRLKPGAWRYRDWVIDALNADLPYDRFLTEQLAGDELPDARLAQYIATGYYRLGIWDDEPTDPLQAVYDDLDGILDTTCRVTMGISMGCARCHDHKGDPIPTTDYYQLLSFFEGLKPYKVGRGNSTNPENFLRSLPADLGASTFEDEIRAHRQERRELIDHVQNLEREVRERWGGEVLAAGDRTSDGLVHHFTFEADASEEIALEGTAWTDGPRGRALLGTGGASGGVIPRPVQDDFTIALWVRADEEGQGGNRDLRWFRGTGLVDGEVPGIVPDFGLSIVGRHVCVGVGEPETFIHSSAPLTLGEWHHVAFTRHRESGRIEIWLDGARVAEGRGGTQSLTAPEVLRIGRMQPGYGSLVGGLDDLRIYERVLSAEEIVDLAIGGGALPRVTEVVRERLGAPEAARHESAVARLSRLVPPSREMVEVLCAQEPGTVVPASFVRVRGNAGSPGEPVEPGFPRILGGGAPTIEAPADGETSGRRLAFARWLTDPEHPLTARVMANRIWQFHFGRGLVRSANDFGNLGDLPTHPGLLDWLASEFIDGGWSLKELHRKILHSSTYRMSSRPDPGALTLDPSNDLLWRFEPRRLAAEELRDSILAVNGSINLELGGPGVYPPMPQEVLATASRPDQAWGRSTPEQAARRSIFIHVKRSLLDPLLVSFDLADTDTSCPVRFVTTQPTQALTLLNSEFSQRQATRMAERLEREHPGDRRAQLRRGLELVSQREVGEAELERQLGFLAELEAEGLTPPQALQAFCLLAINLNEFIHLD
ncbi:MAG: DUF1553 domain-containing protein [Planctomycetota bacterium]